MCFPPLLEAGPRVPLKSYFLHEAITDKCLPDPELLGNQLSDSIPLFSLSVRSFIHLFIHSPNLHEPFYGLLRRFEVEGGVKIFS